MTTKAKHEGFTPGPWELRGDYGTVVFSARREIAICLINIAVKQGVPIAQAQADARLIASAPDLLTERDRLLAENAELVRVMRAAVRLVERYPVRADDADKWISWGIAANQVLARRERGTGAGDARRRAAGGTLSRARR